MFRVPNDKEGQQFIKSLRKYLNRDRYKPRVRGRHTNRNSIPVPLNHNRDVPLKYAEAFAVYIDLRREIEYEKYKREYEIEQEDRAKLKDELKIELCESAIRTVEQVIR
jgi:hypothetical protein